MRAVVINSPVIYWRNSREVDIQVSGRVFIATDQYQRGMFIPSSGLHPFLERRNQGGATLSVQRQACRVSVKKVSLNSHTDRRLS
jgi:hypothetical protein